VEKSDIQKYKELLLGKVGEVKFQLQQSEASVSKVKQLLPSLTQDKIQILETVGVDVGFIHEVDFERMLTDKEYHASIMSRVDSLFAQLKEFIEKGVGYSESKL